MDKYKAVSVILIAILLVVGVVFSVWGYNKTHSNRDGIAVLFMDVWGEFPWSYNNVDVLAKQENISMEEAEFRITEWLKWWDNEVPVNIKEKILPLLKFARENNIEIVFSRNGVVLAPELENLIYKEPIINKTEDLDAYLKGKHIKKIYYAGYATNNCVWGNLTGMKAMSKLGYNVTLIKDASLPIPYQILSYDQVLEEMDKVGDIIYLDDFIKMYGDK